MKGEKVMDNVVNTLNSARGGAELKSGFYESMGDAFVAFFSCFILD